MTPRGWNCKVQNVEYSTGQVRSTLLNKYMSGKDKGGIYTLKGTEETPMDQM